MYTQVVIVLVVMGFFIPSAGTSCEGVKNCANEVVALHGKGGVSERSYYSFAPSCGDIANLSAKQTPVLFCYNLLSLVVNNFPCSTTPPPVAGSGISLIDTPQEEDVVVDSDKEEESGHHKKEGGHGGFLGAEARVWGFTIGSVIGISVAGFACVLILPSMCTVCYNHFQQFLVAMAVGTLSGDAVLHLIPHSYFSHEDHVHGNNTLSEGEESNEALEDSEQKVVIKGIILLSGLFLLYTIEQLFGIVPLYMAARRARLANQNAARGRVESTGSKHSKTHFGGHNHDKGLKHDKSHCHFPDSQDEQLAPLMYHCPSSISTHHFQPSVAYSISCEEVVFRLHGHTKLLEQKECSVVTPCTLPCVPDTPCGEKPCTHLEVARAASFKQKSVETPIPETPAKVPHVKGEYKHGTVLHRCHSADNINVYCTPVCLIPAEPTSPKNGQTNTLVLSATLPKIVEPESEEKADLESGQVKKTETITKYPVESAISIVTAATDVGDHSGHAHAHGHSHGHGHSHSHFGDVNSRAWMVILADAFHNMVDGMAIGVAFSSSLAGGCSTAIAVAMHELPHELGDFAVLLKEGLSIKRGLMFNCISSVICLLGAIMGVGFGSNESFDQLIFALAAGVFLYVSLVDMLPQISSIETSASESVFCHLLIRCGGMLSGTGIMICVAMLEGKIGTFLKALV